MKKVKFIYNPYSGNRTILNKLDEIIRLYQQNGYIVTLYRINKFSELKYAFLDINNKYEHILLSGGDGTLNRVINYMNKNNIDIPIAVIPSGTANDFANLIGMNKNTMKTIKSIINARYHKVDLGKINDMYFINVASIGMFTDISQNINKNIKSLIGRNIYYIKGLKDAFNMKAYNVKIKSDEFSYEGDIYLMLIFNGKTAGNIQLAHKSKLDDGLLDIIIFKLMPRKKIISILLNIIKYQKIEQCEDVIYFKTREIYIECNEELYSDIDGERGPKLPITIKCEESKLDVIY